MMLTPPKLFINASVTKTKYVLFYQRCRVSPAFVKNQRHPKMTLTPPKLLRYSNHIILIGGITFEDSVLSIVERYLIQYPFLGVSVKRDSTAT